MKAVKIIFAVLAALWALALIPKLLAGISNGSGAFVFSHIMGSVVASSSRRPLASLYFGALSEDDRLTNAVREFGLAWLGDRAITSISCGISPLSLPGKGKK
jgi:hypothetical protein